MSDLDLRARTAGSVASAAEVAVVAAELARAGVRDVLSDDASRAHYSSDASLYRLIPTAVVRPRHADEVQAALAVARAHSIPLVARGAGTSVAGNAISSGVVVDFSRHMNRILDVDPSARAARVQPGVVQAHLQHAAAEHGLLFGPDPSTMSRCTIGGMIGNNACGSRSLAYGRTSDNIVALQALTSAGVPLGLQSGTTTATTHDGPAGRLLGELQQLVRANLATIRTEFGTFGRQVSGYALESLLPENGFDVARFLVGSEGSLAVVTEATVNLVPAPKHRSLVVLGFDTMPEAADVMDVLPHDPTACEGLDSRIVDVVRARRGSAAVPKLPDGRAWLFVEVAGGSSADCAQKAARLIGAVASVDARLVVDADEAGALWHIRADGAGLSGRSSDNRAAHAGWEDAAVPPARLGAYLRDFEDLLKTYRLSGFPFGHFGDGCMHIRLDFPLDRPAGADVFARFLTAAAQLVTKYGGSLSGEHGDGRARSQFLPLMYSREALDLFAQVKRVFDPDGVLNPGVVIDPPAATAPMKLRRSVTSPTVRASVSATRSSRIRCQTLRAT
jgi:FAD/FMN-containing dehydrogenase